MSLGRDVRAVRQHRVHWGGELRRAQNCWIRHWTSLASSFFEIRYSTLVYCYCSFYKLVFLFFFFWCCPPFNVTRIDLVFISENYNRKKRFSNFDFRVGNALTISKQGAQVSLFTFHQKLLRFICLRLTVYFVFPSTV